MADMLSLRPLSVKLFDLIILSGVTQSGLSNPLQHKSLVVVKSTSSIFKILITDTGDKGRIVSKPCTRIEKYLWMGMRLDQSCIDDIGIITHRRAYESEDVWLRCDSL